MNGSYKFIGNEFVFVEETRTLDEIINEHAASVEYPDEWYLPGEEEIVYDESDHEGEVAFEIEDEDETVIFPDLDSAQEALDHGETVHIAMESFEIDPVLVVLAQTMQHEESLVAFFTQLGEA